MTGDKITISRESALTHLTALRQMYTVQKAYQEHYENAHVNNSSMVESARELKRKAEKEYEELWVKVFDGSNIKEILDEKLYKTMRDIFKLFEL